MHEQHLNNEQLVEDVHLRDYLFVILRRRKIFLVTFLIILLGVAAYTFTVKPVYEASVTLHVRSDQGRGKGSLADELGLSTQNPVDTEIEILKSVTNAEQVVKILHLDWNIEGRSKGLLFTLLEFATPDGAQQPYTVTLTAPDRFSVADADGNPVAEGRNNTPVVRGEFRLLLAGLKGKVGDNFKLTRIPLDITVTRLQKKIKAAEVGKKTSIIKLTVQNTSPVKAREIANTLAQVYLEQSVGFKSQEASKTVEFLEGQINKLQGSLDESETNLQAYKSASGMVKLEASAEQAVKRLADLDTERATLSLQKKQVEFARTALKEAMARGLVYTPSIIKEDGAVSSLAAKLDDLEIQKKALRQEQTEENPRIRAIQAQIAETQAKLLATYEANLRALDKNLAGVTTLIQENEGELRQLPSAELELARLTRVSKVNADIYLFLLQKHEEARIAKAATISNINVIDPARLPRLPVKPDKKKNLVLAVLVGLMLGAGLAFFADYLDDSIKDSEEAKRLLGIPIMATIPFIPSDGEAQDEYAPSLISHLSPKATVTEAFRSLRTSIHFSGVSKEKKVLLVTSNFPSEGKTTIIGNLAVTMAQTGARVLLVDCDMRRPSLHTLFKQEKVPGLSEVLAGDATADDVLHESGIPGLTFIPAGTTPPNPAELLGSEEMQRLLAGLRLRYDHVLLDAPPYLAVTDAPLLSAAADLMILVLQTERVPAKLAKQTVEMLLGINAPLAGVVINDKTGQAERYGYYGGRYYGYYGHGYNYYGDDTAANKTQQKQWWKKIFR